jgi:hypothetical protein
MILNEGEVICDKCNGTGTRWRGFTCQKCYGKGKLDWVSNAMGRQNVELWYPPAGMNREKITPDIIYFDYIDLLNPSKPVNNLADTKIIAKERGLKC